MRTVLRMATQREELKIVGDQIGAPTSSRDIAAATVHVLSQICAHGSPPDSFSEASGVYHMTAGGETSWYGFAKAILDAISRCEPNWPWFAAATYGRPLITRRLISITTDEYPTPVRRPAYSILSNDRLAHVFRTRLPDWQTQLSSVFSDGALHTPSFGAGG